MEELTREIIKDDRYCKLILKNKTTLAYFMQQFLDEFHHLSIDEIVPLIETEMISNQNNAHIIGLNTEDLDDNKVFFDILFTAALPHSQKENWHVHQSRTAEYEPIQKYVENRAVYYVSRLISRQKKHIRKSKYLHLVKVVSLWLCFDGKNIKMNHIERLGMKKEKYDSEKEEFNEIEDERVHRFFNIIMVYLKYKEDTPFNKIMELLFYKSGIERFAELTKYGIKYEPAEIKEADKMTCILGEEYIQKGFEQGIVLGAEQKLVDNIRQIMNKLNYSLDQAMELFNVEKENQAHIVELIEKAKQE